MTSNNFPSHQIFGVYSCLSFLDDVWDLYKMIGKQKAEEQASNTEQTAQQPGTDQQQQIGAVAKPTDHDSRIWGDWDYLSIYTNITVTKVTCLMCVTTLSNWNLAR